MAKGTETEDAYREIREFIRPKRGEWRYRLPREVFLRTRIGRYKIGGPSLVDDWGLYEDFGDEDGFGADVPFWMEEESLGEPLGKYVSRGDDHHLDKGDVMYVFQSTTPRPFGRGVPTSRIITVALRDIGDFSRSSGPPRVEVDLREPSWVLKLVDRAHRHTGD